MAFGSITKVQRKKGVGYRARITVGYRADGAPIVKGEIFDRRRDAQDWLTATRNALRSGTYVEESDEPLGPYLEHWLQTSTAGPHSKHIYRAVIATHVLPFRPHEDAIELGNLPLNRIDGRRIQDLYNTTRERAPGQAPLVGVVMRSALKLAVAEGLLARNPTDGLTAPRLPRKSPEARVKIWTPAQLHGFLTAMKGHRDWTAWWLIAHTGLRAGETVALRWSDLDLATRTLRVLMNETKDADGRRYHSQPKTTSSRRTIGLDAETVAMLSAHRRTQAERRLANGPGWQAGDLVFDNGKGVVLSASALGGAFGWHVARLRMAPRLSLHDLRHTHASVLLAAGRPLLYVSRRLGHATISITADLYGHIVPGTEHEDAEAFAQAMQRAREA